MSLLRKKKGINSDIPLVEKEAEAKDPGKNTKNRRVKVCISASFTAVTCHVVSTESMALHRQREQYTLQH